MFVATTEKVYCIDSSKSPLPTEIRCTDYPKGKSPKTLAPQSELGCLGALELKLELVRDEGDELRIGGIALGVGHGVAEEPLEGVQITTIPGYLDGVANGPLYSGRSCLEGFRHLGVQWGLFPCLWR